MTESREAHDQEIKPTDKRNIASTQKEIENTINIMNLQAGSYKVVPDPTNPLGLKCEFYKVARELREPKSGDKLFNS